MTKKKRHLPNQAAFVTRRVNQGEFLLLLDAAQELKQLMLYSIALHSQSSNQLISAFVVMANHIHYVLYDPNGNRSDLTRDFHSCTARSVNKFRNRNSHFWDGGGVDDPPTLDRDALIEKIAYTVLNPVRAGIVEKAADYPLNIMPDDWGKTIKVKRPDFYFRASKAHPDVLEFTPQPPHGFEGRNLHYLRKEVNKAIRRGERYEAKRRRENGMKVKGLAALYNESPNRRTFPKTENCRTEFFATDAATYKRAKASLKKFRHDLTNAIHQFKHDRNAAFPAGTIQMRKRFGIKCCDPEYDDPFVVDYNAPVTLAA